MSIPKVAPESAARRLVPVLENVQIAHDTVRIRLGDPIMARSILPGQFVMIRPGPQGSNDPLLGRPFALYEVVRDEAGIPVAFDVVYLILGRGTAALSQRRAGDKVSVWGPLGNGFGPAPGGPVYFVAGGIGQTPFLALGRWWLGKQSYGLPGGAGDRRGEVGGALVANTGPVTLFYGVRKATLLAGVEDFRRAGMQVEIATDDGSAGHHGFVTDLVADRLEQGEQPSRIVGCGPPPMLAALARLAKRHQVSCEVSLENHMACGFGVCFSCVTPIRQPDGTSDLRRVCIEGPVFDAENVDWSEMAH